jgi:hypothetical protein
MKASQYQILLKSITLQILYILCENNDVYDNIRFKRKLHNGPRDDGHFVIQLFAYHALYTSISNYTNM